MFECFGANVIEFVWQGCHRVVEGYQSSIAIRYRSTDHSEVWSNTARVCTCELPNVLVAHDDYLVYDVCWTLDTAEERSTDHRELLSYTEMFCRFDLSSMQVTTVVLADNTYRSPDTLDYGMEFVPNGPASAVSKVDLIDKNSKRFRC